MDHLKLLLIGAALLGWLFRAKHVQGSARWYFLLLIAATTAEFIGAWLVDQGRTSNTSYQLFIPIEIVLASLFITTSSTERWPRRWPLLGLLAYAALLGWEWRNSTGEEILFSRSLLFAWALLVLACCVVLMQRSHLLHRPIWRTWQFWALLSLLSYFGLALPTVGLIGQLYVEDPDLASKLFGFIDVLFFLRYGSAIVAAALLTSPEHHPRVATP